MDFGTLSTPDYGNILGREHFMDIGIRSLWQPVPSIAGKAYTVQLSAGDHLMLHAAIYHAPAGSIVVVDGVDSHYAVAGGNVCTAAKARGIKGFVVDGVVRDLAEIRALPFPVFARGVFPVPGKKSVYSPLAQPITCGGVQVATDDIIVADEDGIVVIPPSTAAQVYQQAKNKADAEKQTPFSQWQIAHQQKIAKIIADKTK